MKILDNADPILTKESNGHAQISFTSLHFERWHELNLIPKHLADHFFESLERVSLRIATLRQFKEKNPNSTTKDFFEESLILTQKETDLVLLDGKMQIELHEFMLENWEALLKALSSSKSTSKLFREVDPSRNFGIVKVETDCLYRFQELLDSMIAIRVSEDDYKARGEIKFTNGNCAALEYDLRAKSREEAILIVNEFKKMMLGKGLKVWLAFWKMANETGKSRFECRISDVMALITKKDRKSHFNDEERTEFWSITRSLNSTRFVLEWPAKKNSRYQPKKKSSEPTRWIQQPLLRIFSGERELGKECPIKIGIEVLTDEIAREKFSPAFLSNGTLLLHPTDIPFALIIQSRAAQTNGQVIELDWAFTFKIANLSGTAKANPRKAKASVRKKLGKFQEEEIISNWGESKKNVRITPQKQKASEKKTAQNPT